MKLALKKLDFLLIYLTLSFVAVGVIRKIIAGIVTIIQALPAPLDDSFAF